MNKTITLCLLMSTSCFCAAAPLGEGAFDMISISADEASEDEQPGILHFNGNFLMRSTDWRLTSEEATVYGSPDKPDRVYLEGTPARFLINRDESKNQGQIKAAAEVVEYLRDENLLTLSGGATLILDDEVIRSSHIEYDIKTNRYRAGGSEGVLIEVPPVN